MKHLFRTLIMLALIAVSPALTACAPTANLLSPLSQTLADERAEGGLTLLYITAAEAALAANRAGVMPTGSPLARSVRARLRQLEAVVRTARTAQTLGNQPAFQMQAGLARRLYAEITALIPRTGARP